MTIVYCYTQFDFRILKLKINNKNSNFTYIKNLFSFISEIFRTILFYKYTNTKPYNYLYYYYEVCIKNNIKSEIIIYKPHFQQELEQYWF